MFKVDFDTMKWEDGRPGVRAFAAGDGLFIPAGAGSAHRGVTIEPGTRLVMVEDAG